MSENVAPLQQKKKKKEAEKDRIRSHGAQEEELCQTALNNFNGDVESLQKLTAQIDTYVNSDKNKDLQQISSKVAAILETIEMKRMELGNLEPKLQALQRAVDDQERHKKLLRQNVEIIEATSRMEVLERDIHQLEEKRIKISGSSTVRQDYRNARRDKELLVQEKSKLEGSLGTHMDQYYALKVRRLAPFC